MDDPVQGPEEQSMTDGNDVFKGELAKMAEVAQRNAARLREAEQKMASSIAAKDFSFCPKSPERCQGYIDGPNGRVICPSGPGACPHYAARMVEVTAGKLRAIGFGESVVRPSPQALQGEMGALVGYYCATIDDRLRAGEGLCLCGDVGTGKTSALAMIASAAMVSAHAPTVILSKAIDLANDLRDDGPQMGHSRREKTMDAVKRAGLWLLDDFGAEDRKWGVAADIAGLIDHRWEHKLATCITSNAPREVLARGQEWKRTIDRLDNRNRWAWVPGQSMRAPVGAGGGE